MPEPGPRAAGIWAKHGTDLIGGDKTSPANKLHSVYECT